MVHINDLLGKNLRVLGLGLILSCGAGESTPAGGCKNDSECKGDRYCIDGECVEGSRNVPGKDTYSSLPDTYNLDTSQNCTSHFKKVCSDGDLYWQDSCKNLENKLDNCAYGCSNGKCNEPMNDVYRYEDVYVGKDTPTCEVSSPCEVEGDKKCSINKVVMQCVDQGSGCLGYIFQDCSEKGMYCENGECVTSCSEYTCNEYGTCIPQSWVCDGVADCNSGEDEGDCSTSCPEYTCNDGNCIPEDYVCDGGADCSNGEDEEGCCVNECDPGPKCDEHILYLCVDANEDGCREWNSTDMGCD